MRNGLDYSRRWDPSLIVQAEDGRILIEIDLETGAVRGAVEDAGEAGRVFVESVRHHWLQHRGDA